MSDITTKELCSRVYSESNMTAIKGFKLVVSLDEESYIYEIYMTSDDISKVSPEWDKIDCNQRSLDEAFVYIGIQDPKELSFEMMGIWASVYQRLNQLEKEMAA